MSFREWTFDSILCCRVGSCVNRDQEHAIGTEWHEGMTSVS